MEILYMFEEHEKLKDHVPGSDLSHCQLAEVGNFSGVIDQR